jgi:hypothetical protein
MGRGLERGSRGIGENKRNSKGYTTTQKLVSKLEKIIISYSI